MNKTERAKDNNIIEAQILSWLEGRKYPLILKSRQTAITILPAFLIWRRLLEEKENDFIMCKIIMLLLIINC